MTLAPSTSYLLEQSGVRPDSATPQEILITQARRIRDLVRHWWLALDPENTAGASVELMESSLVLLAKTLARLPSQRLGTFQALQLVTSKLVSIHGRAEQVIAKRLLDAASRLGVLRLSGIVSTVSFAHPSLFELYLGLAYQQESKWPAQLEREPLLSLKPLNQHWGRAAWARLRFTEPEQFDDAFGHLASTNLHLAAWYLFCDEAARERFGAGFSASLLELASWDHGQRDQEMLDQLLASLADSGVEAARACLFERESILPTVWLAARVLGRFGSSEDIERLTSLAADPALGRWEIERMRQAIREAQSLTLEPEVLRRYRKEELMEFGKKALEVLALIGGAILVTQLAFSHRLLGMSVSHSTAHAGAHAGAHSLVHSLGHLNHEVGQGSTSTLLALQRTLREKLAFLPAEIERRKAEIERTRPQVQQELETAARVLADRGRQGS